MFLISNLETILIYQIFLYIAYKNVFIFPLPTILNFQVLINFLNLSFQCGLVYPTVLCVLISVVLVLFPSMHYGRKFGSVLVFFFYK